MDIVAYPLDKNCALRAEQAAIERSFAGITIDPRAADDPRPAPAIGPDNFARHRDAAHGFAIDYPARWTPVQAPGVSFAAVAPDKKAFVAVAVQPAGPVPYPQADLQILADRALEQLGHVVAPLAHTVRRIGGNMWVVARPADILFDQQGVGGSASAMAAVTVARGRIYLLQSWDVVTGPGNDDRDIVLPFFSPFYAPARATALDYYETESWAAQLEGISLGSFTLDPGAPDDRRPAPIVGIDNFTRHTSTADDYHIDYPAQWKAVADAGSGIDLDVGPSDGSVRLAVAAGPADGAATDLRAVADRIMAPFLKGGVINQPSTYRTVRLNGQSWLVAHNDRADSEAFDAQGVGHYTDRVVTILVTVRQGRLYVAVGWVRQDISNTTDQNVALVYASLDTLTLT